MTPEELKRWEAVERGACRGCGYLPAHGRHSQIMPVFLVVDETGRKYERSGLENLRLSVLKDLGLTVIEQWTKECDQCRPYTDRKTESAAS